MHRLSALTDALQLYYSNQIHEFDPGSFPNFTHKIYFDEYDFVKIKHVLQSHVVECSVECFMHTDFRG